MTKRGLIHMCAVAFKTLKIENKIDLSTLSEEKLRSILKVCKKRGWVWPKGKK
jgi:hypothetical protein